MKINCNYFQKNDATFQHNLCRNYHKCSITKPTTPKTQLLNKEIAYLLKQLKKAKWNVKQYNEVLTDIKNHKYSFTVNVYGHIIYAPKQNAFGVTIKRPEHVNYGWNLNKLLKVKEDLTEKVRKLRSIEYHIDDYSEDEIIEIIREVENNDTG